MTEEAVSKHQSKKARSGKKLELNVKQILNNILDKEGIIVAALNEIDAKKSIIDDEHKEKIIDFIKVRFPTDCSQEYRLDLPDTDLIVLYRKKNHDGSTMQWYVLGIISCKVSFHARETESTFWASVLKYHSMRMVMVTEDKDRYTTRTELGTCEKPTAARRRLETFMDRVYIIKQYGNGNAQNKIMEDISSFYDIFNQMQSRGYRTPHTQIFDDYETKFHCGYCNKVKPFDDLISDIMMWKMERTQ